MTLRVTFGAPFFMAGVVLTLSLIIPPLANAAEDGTPQEIYLRQGNRLYWEGGYTAAEIDFTNAILYSPSWAIAYNNRGLARMKQGKFAEAESDFEQAKAVDTDYTAPYLNKGKCLAAQKKYAEAISELQAGIALNNKRAGVLQWKPLLNCTPWDGREAFTTVVFHDKIWILGGTNWIYFADPLAHNDVWCSMDGIVWTEALKVAPWPARCRHTSFVFDDKIWVLGGQSSAFTKAGYFNDVWCSSDGIAWTQVLAKAPWNARSGHSSVVFDNKMWVLGGRAQENSFDLCDVWCSTDGVEWTQVVAAAPWLPRSGHSSVVFDNKMWVLGGLDRGMYAYGDVWCSSSGTDWTNTLLNAPWGPRAGHASVVINNNIIVMRGYERGELCLWDIWQSRDGASWSLVRDSTPWPGFAVGPHSEAAVVFGNCVLGFSCGIEREGLSPGCCSVWRTGDANLLFNLGWVYDELGRYSDAISSYEAAIMSEPDCQKAFIAKAVTLAKLEATADAQAMLEASQRPNTNTILNAIAEYDLRLLQRPGLAFHDAGAAQDYQQGVFYLGAGLPGLGINLFHELADVETDVSDVALMLAIGATMNRSTERANTSAFAALPQKGDKPLIVQFTDQSTGIISEYEWDFGDGIHSSEHNPQHTYFSAGTYTVTLTTKAPGWSDSKSIPITVDETFGSVTVSVDPPNAHWSFMDGAGQVHSGTGSQTVSNVPTGTIALTWDPLWFHVTPDAPAAQTLNIGSTVVFSGTYRALGIVEVDVTPFDAPWSFIDSDGRSYIGTGPWTIFGVPTGVVSFQWENLTWYDAPTTVDSQVLTLGKTVTFTGTYTRQAGVVMVQVTPATASWSFIDGDGQTHVGTGSETISDVPTGSIVFLWGSLANHTVPETPVSQTLYKDEIITFSGNYIRDTGKVQVNATPSAAPWSFIDGDGLAHVGMGNSIVNSVPTGSIVLSWGTLNGYTIPGHTPAQTLELNGTVSFSGTYTRQTGKVTVQVSPDTAGWSFTDGDGQEHTGSGPQTLNDIPTGRIALEWHALDKYTTPTSPSAEILLEGGLLVFEGTYSRQTGTVQITATPSNAAWTFTDAEQQMHSGVGNQTLGDVPTGEIVLRWDQLEGYTSPKDPHPQTLGSNGTVTFSGTFVRETGSVQIAVTPNTAPWTFLDADGAIHRGIGTTTLDGIPTGLIALTWDPLNAYVRPPLPSSQTLTVNDTITFTGVYSRQTGSVQVSVTPVTAPWTFTDGDGKIHSGTGSKMLSDIPTGAISLSWGVLSGYASPDIPIAKTLNVSDIVTFSGAYARQTGSVQVNVTPSTAPWFFTDADGQTHSGPGSTMVVEVPTGPVTLTWGALTGYIAPVNPPIQELDANRTVTFSGAYTHETGTVQIDVIPSSAPWSFIDSEGQTHSGIGPQTLPGIPTGEITIAWGALENYAEPTIPSVQTLTGGGTIVFSGTYTRHAGLVQIDVSPATASWSFVDGDGQTRTGIGSSTVADVPTGQITLTWGVLAGYVAPGNPPVQTLKIGETAMFHGDYVGVGTVRVNVTPANVPWAFTDGAMQVHAGTGSQTLENVPGDSIYMVWGDLDGYMLQDGSSTSLQELLPGGTAVFSATYVRTYGSVCIEVGADNGYNDLPWSFTDGDGQVHRGRGSQTVPNVPTGQIRITWEDSANYTRPTEATVESNLWNGGMVSFSGYYTRRTGIVEISPDYSMTAYHQVPWTFVDGDGEIHNGRGAESLSVPTGTISFTWLPLDGYQTPVPAQSSQVLSSGGKVTFSATYTPDQPPVGCMGGILGSSSPKNQQGDLTFLVVGLALAVVGRGGKFFGRA